MSFFAINKTVIRVLLAIASLIIAVVSATLMISPYSLQAVSSCIISNNYKDIIENVNTGELMEINVPKKICMVGDSKDEAPLLSFTQDTQARPLGLVSWLKTGITKITDWIFGKEAVTPEEYEEEKWGEIPTVSFPPVTTGDGQTSLPTGTVKLLYEPTQEDLNRAYIYTICKDVTSADIEYDFCMNMGREYGIEYIETAPPVIPKEIYRCIDQYWCQGAVGTNKYGLTGYRYSVWLKCDKRESTEYIESTIYFMDCMEKDTEYTHQDFTTGAGISLDKYISEVCYPQTPRGCSIFPIEVKWKSLLAKIGLINLQMVGE